MPKIATLCRFPAPDGATQRHLALAGPALRYAALFVMVWSGADLFLSRCVLPNIGLSISLLVRRSVPEKSRKIAFFKGINEIIGQNEVVESDFASLREVHLSGISMSVRPSVRPSVLLSIRQSVPCYFRKTKIVDFENNYIYNTTMSEN